MNGEDQLPDLLSRENFCKILGEDFFALMKVGDPHVLHRLETSQDPGLQMTLVLALADFGHTDLIRLVNRSEVLVAKDSRGRGVLHYASFRGHQETVDCILREFGVPLLQDTDGHTALQYACTGGNAEVVQSLLRVFAQSRTEVDSAGSVTVSEPPSRRTSDVAELTSGLIRAARKGHVKVVLQLLRDHNTELRRPLELGLGGGRNTLLHLLGRSISAQELFQLNECGLKIDLTAPNLHGVHALRQVPPKVLKEFLDLSVTLTPEHADSNTITESYTIKNPFACPTHDLNAHLDLRTIIDLSRSIKHRHLIFHPLFLCICAIKWRSVRGWYYGLISLLLMLATVTSSIAVFSVQNAYFYESLTVIQSQVLIYQGKIKIWQIILCCVLTILGTLELASYLKNKWWLNAIRYTTWSICYVTLIYLLTCHVALIQGTSFFIIIVPWLACVKNVGHHYLLSQYYSNFIEITKTILKITIVFGSLIIAFVLIFHIMMLGTQNQQIFNYLHTSGLKMVSMMVGDLAIDDFSERFTDLQWSATQLVFTIVITIILYNMMNALAVSDTDRLTQEAEVYRTVSLAKQILFFQILLHRLSQVRFLSEIVPAVPNVTELVVNCNCYRWRIEEYLQSRRERSEHQGDIEDDQHLDLDMADQNEIKLNYKSVHVTFDLDYELADKIKESVECRRYSVHTKL